MLLLVPSEISRYAALVATNSLLRSTNNKIAFIAGATASAEAHCFRSKYGFDIREVYDAQIRLDKNLGGRLPAAPFLGWLEDQGELTLYGQNTSAGAIDLADFSIDSTWRKVLIRSLSNTVTTPGGDIDDGFSSGQAGYKSIYSEATSSYHLRGRFGEVYDNQTPYLLKASFRTGLFYESLVDTSGAPGDSEIHVADASYFLHGRECYFDTDPLNERMVDSRFITAVDLENNVVEFRPALGVAVPAGSYLRMIDKAVRSAVGDIITDMLTYPSNTKTFIKNLSKFDIAKQWARTTDKPVPGNAAEKLEAYRLL